MERIIQFGVWTTIAELSGVASLLGYALLSRAAPGATTTDHRRQKGVEQLVRVQYAHPN
jgi:hypothetical protein